MAKIHAFKGFRPGKQNVNEVASRPYDVLNSEEARIEVEGNPWSFLHVVKPEVDLPEGTDLHSDLVYNKGKENLDRLIAEGYFVQDEQGSSLCLWSDHVWKDPVRDSGLCCCGGLPE